jgi:hypothetical protein
MAPVGRPSAHAPLRLLVRLAVTSVVGHLVFSTVARAAGMLAFLAVPAAFFLGGWWAAGCLGVSPTARIGFGIPVLASGVSAFWVFIGTQAWSPDFGFLRLFLPAAALFVIADTAAAVVGLAPLMSRLGRDWALGVFGFAAGAAMAAFLLVATLYSSGSAPRVLLWASLPVFYLVPVLPAMLGGTIVSGALSRRSASAAGAGGGI